MSGMKPNVEAKSNGVPVNRNPSVRKIGYLRKLKDKFIKSSRDSTLFRWSIPWTIDGRMRCRPCHCRCDHKNVFMRVIGRQKSNKTMKKKFFVLREEKGTEPATLEYYDSEKKWKSGALPKRMIALKTCFNINRKLDTKHKHAIALYTKDDCFTIVLDTEEELDEWLSCLLELQHGKEAFDADEPPKPTFEHIWQVNVRNRGLASSKNILGNFHLCLTSKILSLVKLNTEVAEVYEFPLMSIRRCGHSYCFFFMELGRSAVTGSGELWMQTEDVIIAQNMHEAILNAMRASAKDDLAPRPRTRSSSANESSKPISVHIRRQTTVAATGLPNSIGRERCDSFPRPRTISEGPRDFTGSPGSAPYTADSNGSSLSIDDHDGFQFDFFPSSKPEPPITEEGLDYFPMSSPDRKNKGKQTDASSDGYMDMASPSSVPQSFLTNFGNRSLTPTLSASVPVVAQLSKSPPQQGPYVDLNTNSPTDSGDGYMPMSPVGSTFQELAIKPPAPMKSYVVQSPTNSFTSTRTRKTSIDELESEGYIPMAPLSSSQKSTREEGYMEMNVSAAATPTSKTSKADGSYLEMAPVSTPGSAVETPSSELRFPEFQLEKVRAYFADEDDEEEERIVRAYSVGSKPGMSSSSAASKVSDSQSAVDNGETSRARALSVGSKVGLQFEKKSSKKTKDQTAEGAVN